MNEKPSQDCCSTSPGQTQCAPSHGCSWKTPLLVLLAVAITVAIMQFVAPPRPEEEDTSPLQFGRNALEALKNNDRQFFVDSFMNPERFVELTADSPWGRKVAETGYKGLWQGMDQLSPEDAERAGGEAFEKLLGDAGRYDIDVANCLAIGARCNLADHMEPAEREGDRLSTGLEYAEIEVYFECKGSTYCLFMECMKIDNTWCIADDVSLRKAP